MIYNLINVASIVIGSLIGILFKRFIPERVTNNLNKAVGLAVIFMAIDMFVIDVNVLHVVIILALGTLIGAWIDIDGMLDKFAKSAENKNPKVEKLISANSSQIAEAFVFTTILYCAGSMAIVGSLQAGLVGNGDILLTKSVLDGVSSVVYGASMGIGVTFSAISVLIYQGIFVLLAQFLNPILNDVAIALISAVGGVMIMGIGINMISDTELKISNMIPAIFLPIIMAAVGFI
ncbi:MAG: DUF554 domain-containing protein [Clostridiaceae bacterium]|nr:DUF554 domain-containing protein [Clostridiaceae bacterium]